MSFAIYLHEPVSPATGEDFLIPETPELLRLLSDMPGARDKVPDRALVWPRDLLPFVGKRGQAVLSSIEEPSLVVLVRRA